MDNIDSLNVVITTVENGDVNISHSNLWLWCAISLAVLIIILLLVILNFKKRNADISDKELLKSRVMSGGTIDFDNIIDSSFNAVELYNQLKVCCHPDRFPNDKEKQDIATDIFQRITENKSNVKMLRALQSEANERLGV